MGRALTTRQVLSITGTEPPLTEADIDRAVWRAYAPWRAELAIAGDPAARASDWGCAGDGLSAMADRRGLWVHIHDTPPRAGHIPWTTAEAILRTDHHGRDGQGALFDLENP